MKLRSADVETIWGEISYRHESDRLPRWRFRLARAVYLTSFFLLRRLAA